MTEKEEKIMKAIRFVQTTSLTPYKIAQDTKITEATIGNCLLYTSDAADE